MKDVSAENSLAHVPSWGPPLLFRFHLTLKRLRFLGHRNRWFQSMVTSLGTSILLLWPRVVRRLSVRRLLDNLYFRLLLQNCLMDFDETWYGWSSQAPLQVLLFFSQIRPGVDQRRAKVGHGGPILQKNFFFRLEGYSNKPNAYQWTRTMWEEVLLFWSHTEVEYLTRFGRVLIFGLYHFVLF